MDGLEFSTREEMNNYLIKKQSENLNADNDNKKLKDCELMEMKLPFDIKDGEGILSFKISGNKNEKPLVIFIDSKTGKYMIPEDFLKDEAKK